MLNSASCSPRVVRISRPSSLSIPGASTPLTSLVPFRRVPIELRIESAGGRLASRSSGSPARGAPRLPLHRSASDQGGCVQRHPALGPLDAARFHHGPGGSREGRSFRRAEELTQSKPSRCRVDWHVEHVEPFCGFAKKRRSSPRFAASRVDGRVDDRCQCPGPRQALRRDTARAGPGLVHFAPIARVGALQEDQRPSV
jgi:hypothetical protein